MGSGGCGGLGAWGVGSWWFQFGLPCFVGFGVCSVGGIEEGGIDFLEGVEAAVEVNPKA